MMNRKDLRIDIRVEPSEDKKYYFCQALIATRIGIIGDPDAWALTGLVSGGIGDLLTRLAGQEQMEEVRSYLARLSAPDLFAALHSWQDGDDNWRTFNNCPHDNFGIDSLIALPQGTELFDGELAFLVRVGADTSRLIWQDYESKDIREMLISFKAYVLEWQTARSLVSSFNRQ